MSEPTALSPAADLPPDDLLREVFLRLPPEPGHLLSASLVCRHWRRLVRDPAFLRLFRAFHRTPPVLGFFQNLSSIQPHIGRYTRFVPTAAVSGFVLPDGKRMRQVLDCRHGRVLFHSDLGLLVWDPMVGDTHYMGLLQGSKGWDWDFTASVICAAGHDSHMDCHSSSFRVVFVESVNDDEHHDHLATSHVYSSETGTWSSATTISSPSAVTSYEASALVGNSLCWLLDFAGTGKDHILEFELHSQRLNLIELPDGVRDGYMFDIHLMPAEDGGIGFAQVKESSIHFWSRRIGHHEGADGWVLLKMVDLHELPFHSLAARDTWLESTVVGFAEDSNMLFLESGASIIMINLGSMQLSEVPYARGSSIYPYTSFYTPGRDIVGIDDRAAE
ncbi:unnamed protein product [Urochloa decumbens]|uniref:F-box domain-containing protein n=1 Tax=Urochloa decumbens TaxID=240449 RepID=A0ABC8WV38_9POAL